MCFSAPGSIVTGTVLAASGLYAIEQAKDRDKSFLMFASIPFFFGIQQLIEGVVWIAFGKDQAMVAMASQAYVFFAFAFWPFFSPLAVYFAEKPANVFLKRLLWLLILVGLVIGLLAYFPILLGSVRLIVQVVHHSISYDTDRPEILKRVYLSLYLLSVIVPFLVVRDLKMKVFGVLLIFSVLMSYLFFSYAFDSVWCLFAAVLSLYIIYIMRTLPAAKAALK